MVGYKDKSDADRLLQLCGGNSNTLVIANDGISPIAPDILVPLNKIKSLREDAVKYRDNEENDFVDFEIGAINGVIAMIDNLIAEVEEANAQRSKEKKISN